MTSPHAAVRNVGRPARRSCRRVGRIARAAIVLLPLILTGHAAPAQRAGKVPRIGILSPYAAAGSSFAHDVKQGLAELGHVEGSTIVYEASYGDGRTDRLPDLAADLVRRKVDIVVTTTAPAVRAAMQATTTIPIVIGGVDDAVEQGFVARLAKPGGNVTGTSWLNVELSEKRIDVLKHAVPGLSRVAVLREAVGAGATVRAVMAAAQAIDVRAYVLELRDRGELDDAFAEMGRLRVGGLSVLESPMIAGEGSRIASLALHHRIPSIFPDRRFLDAGGLMSYGPSLPAMYRRAATYVDRILKGAKAAELPVEQPTVFALVVNRRSAKLLGLSLPETILVRAEIIE
jgi:putative ABC transport system substrate-binding protein